MFGEGTEVEVLVKIKYDLEVWYPATVVENHGDGSFLVEYRGAIEVQRVSVGCSCIRPSPPSLEDRVFGLLEKVDAFREGGWWAGDIVKALPDNRYSVFIKSLIGEFDQREVRPQLGWKDGKWWFVSSQEEVTTPSKEKNGGHVVSDLNDVSSGGICESKIILEGEKTEQKSSLSSNSRESKPWKKFRNDPCTPKGVLVGVNSEKSEFPSSSLGENQTDLVDLGHHKSHGVASSPKKVKHSSKIPTHLEKKFKREGDSVTPSCISSRQSTATCDKQNEGIDLTSGSLPSNITGENMIVDLTSGDQPSDYPSLGMRTPKKQKKMDGKEIHTLNYRRKPRQAGEECIKGFTKLAKPVSRDSGGEEDDVAFIRLECCNLSGSKARKTCLNNVEESLKLEGDQKKQLNDQPLPDQPEAEKSSYMKRRGRSKKVYARRKKAKVTEQISDTANHDTIIKDRTMSEVDSQVAPGSMLISMEGLLPAENFLMPIGDQLNHGNDLSGERKSSFRMPIDSNDQASINEHERQMPKEAKRRITSDRVSKIPDISDDEEAPVSPFLSNGMLADNNHFPLIDTSDGTVVMTTEPFCITKEVNRTVQQEPGVVSDQPLLMCEKMHSPDTVNNSTPGATTAIMVEQSIELRQTRKELNGQTASGKDNKDAAVMKEEVDAQNHACVGDTMVEQSAILRHTRKEMNEQIPSAKDNKAAAVMSGDVDAQNHVCVDSDTMVEPPAKLRQTRKEQNGQTPSAKDNRTAAVMSEEVAARSRVLVEGNTSITTTGEPELPFVKRCSLWKLVESSEALCKMPQKPHYRPLQQYKESLREGFAIAFTVNFSSVVEKISQLRFDTATKQKIDDILDSLNDLENHGFQVQVLRDRIAELESIKEKHKKHLEEVDVINKQIVSCSFDKDEQDMEISEVKKQIQELHERAAKAESIKKMKDGEIAVLESRLVEAEEAIRSAKSHYEDIAFGVM